MEEAAFGPHPTTADGGSAPDGAPRASPFLLRDKVADGWSSPCDVSFVLGARGRCGRLPSFPSPRREDPSGQRTLGVALTQSKGSRPSFRHSPGPIAAPHSLVILSGASAPLLFRRVFCGGRTRSRRTCLSLLEDPGVPPSLPELIEGVSPLSRPGRGRTLHFGTPSDPVKHGLVRDPGDWKWSSFRHYASARSVWWRLSRSGREEIASSK